MERAHDTVREAMKHIIIRAIDRHRAGRDGGTPVPIDIAERVHELGQAPTYLCVDCGLPVLDVEGYHDHLHTFDPRCLRECDDCGKVEEASNAPDWINGLCVDCDPELWGWDR